MGSIWIGWRLFTMQMTVVGSLALATFFAFQAAGHFDPRRWGPKVTAVLAGVVNVGFIIYLIPGYEKELIGEFGERLLGFTVSIFVTLVFVTNYLACKRLREQTKGE
jgi:hypothetical protein